MVCLSDGLPVAVDWWPVVSNLDTLPACEGVAVMSVGVGWSACRMVCLWLLIGGLWSVTSTPCQPVRVWPWCLSVWDGLPV